MAGDPGGELLGQALQLGRDRTVELAPRHLVGQRRTVVDGLVDPGLALGGVAITGRTATGALLVALT
ncbi:hypothetical protein GCM10022215_05840 [Nocardioides fonticola]|uniref:Uncharacterized protein n=1 Tax=Nocardioides fonticola TaxID=450363 RepID=A0ABP7XBP0_9ACTN